MPHPLTLPVLVAHNPITRDPVRVHPDLLPFLKICWPGGADPLGFLGYSSPATSWSVAPKRYSINASNSPVGANEAFTFACVLTVSATVPSATQYILSTAVPSSLTAGFTVALLAGSVLTFYTFDAAGNQTAVAGSPSFAAGQRHTVIGVHNPRSYTALFVNGTLSSSTSATRSWTAQNTFNLGWSGSGGVWSGGLTDVCLFHGALSADQVGVLHHWMK